jgi:nucleoside-diphosphate-sugar epimerase
LTSDNAYPWNEIYREIGRALGVEPMFAAVPSETLVRYRPAWQAGLLGDKTWSAVFDNSKIKSVVGDFDCPTTLDDYMARIMPHYEKRRASFEPDAEHEALVDRIITEQQALGA